MDRAAAYVRSLEREVPGFRIVRKDHAPSQRLIDGALRVVTFGAQRHYLDGYQTTIGRTLFVTPDWDAMPADRRYVTLRHEAVHLRQFQRYGLVGMAVLYLLVPLPLGLAWFRARFEKEGYAETVRATAEVYGLDAARSPELRAHVIAQFTSGAYGWMWPFRAGLERWYDGVLAELGAI